MDAENQLKDRVIYDFMKYLISEELLTEQTEKQMEVDQKNEAVKN